MVMLLPGVLQAQEGTRVSGSIFDSETKEPLPFVSVNFKNTRIGVNSDVEGRYSIATTQPVDSLIFTYIGYLRQAIKIKVNTTSQNVNIYLKPDTRILDSVVVVPGENPAHAILRKVIRNKPINNKDKLDAYQYEVYNKIEFDLKDIPGDVKNNKMMKSVQFIFDYIDSSNVNKGEKPSLPLMLSEAVSDFYFKRNPHFKKEVIKASRISGVEDKSVSQFMGEMYLSVNIYKNNVLVFDKNFVSPISDNGLFYYKYYLIDSMFVDGRWCYQIMFKPKRKQELLFEGNMWINDTSFAVKRFEMSIAKDANINYVNTLNVIHDYVEVDSAWMLKKERLVIDFKWQKKLAGFYGRKTTSYDNFVINKPKEDDFYSKTDNLIVSDDANKKDEDYWKNARKDSLTKTEGKIYEMVDSLQNLKIYKTWQDIVILFYSGYQDMGYWELGPYYNMLSFNTYENLRLRVGGRTSNKFSRWCEINGYVAYGFLDEQFKYSLNYKTFITKKPRQILYLGYKKDYEILGQSQYSLTTDNILTSLFRRNPVNALTNVEQYQVAYEFEPFKGFNNKLYFTHRSLSPLNEPYHIQQLDGSVADIGRIKTSEIKLVSRLAWDEKYIEGTFARTSTGTKWPIVQVEYTPGLKGVLESDYTYQKLYLNIDDRIRLTPFGYLNYIIEGGKIFGKVPYPLMFLHPGNETYIYDWASYNMMNYYEFASDEFAALSLHQHFDGFFLNKIPLMRKLKWREVLVAKALYGAVAKGNRDVLLFPNTLHTFDHGLYYEVGAGIENIFRIFRIDATWRLSYIDQAYKDQFYQTTGHHLPIFGIRGSVQVMF
jgi:hypothetical protein